MVRLAIPKTPFRLCAQPSQCPNVLIRQIANLPAVTFVRLDPSIEPVQLVHRICSEAYANPEVKKSRYIQRMHPVTKIEKTLRVDLEAFAKEILKPYFHSGGPPKTVSAMQGPI